MDAVRLRLEAWNPLFTHRTDGELLMPILLLCSDENGDPFFPEGELEKNFY